MTLRIKKLVSYEEEIFIEGFKKVDIPVRMFAVAVVINNPWAGRYVENLTPEIRSFGPILGQLLTDKISTIAGEATNIEAFGKAAVVGLNGEIEHASALIHTLHFGNIFREAVQAKSFLSFTNTRGPANAPISIPMMDKNDGGRRSHYLTLQFSISDAPGPDELVIVLAGSTSGRPHHRIGDRYQELKELGHDVENPASI